MKINMTADISRRDFLKFSGAALIGLKLGDYSPFDDPYSRIPSMRLGRTIYSLRYYDIPSFSGNEIGFYNTDTVIRILEERVGDPEPAHNPIWVRTEDGWLHSSYIQPVKNELNRPVRDFPAGGRLFEVTVPYTQAWKISDEGKKRAYRFYYGSTYWVKYAIVGSDGNVWYQIDDDHYDATYAVFATHMRLISNEELLPISQDVENKKILVDLPKQRLTAYENERPVYFARIATGYFEGDTPLGEYRVERKQPSRHMAGGGEGNQFDLPGVPWVCYISWTGVSLHGTYWHNNYGTPQSHGCINLSLEASKWIYRWTDPFVPVEEDYVGSDHGTRVIVI